MNKKEIPIMFCFDNNYVIPAGVAFYSMLKHCNKKYYYKLYVLHTDITKSNQIKLVKCIDEFKENSSIEFINMEHRFQDIWNTISTKGHFSKEVMYKVLVASIFPQYDKIIVSDVDVVFLNDISDSFFYLDVEEDYYLAGIRMIGKYDWYLNIYDKNFTKEEKKKLSGFCGGYIVFNLKKLRKDNMEQKFINSFIENGKRINQMEQDILNLCCYPKTKLLPLKYLACSYMWDTYKTKEDFLTDGFYSEEEIKDAMNNTVQLHYATFKKPWKYVDCTKGEIWFKYLCKTNFLNDYLKELPDKIELKEKRKKMIKKELNNVEKEKIYYEEVNKRHLLNIINDKLNNYKLYTRLKLLIKNPKYVIKKLLGNNNKEKIILLDDLYPCKFSNFRNEEFNYILRKYNNSKIYTTGKTIKYFNKNYRIKNLITDYTKINNDLKNKIFIFKKNINYSNSIAHMIFLHNAYSFLPFLEKNKIPFGFVLYPGGDFALNNVESDNKLKRVLSSPYFKYVIATQDITYNYLKSKKLCNEEKIYYIYGIVSSQQNIINEPKKVYFKRDKYFLNICFAANKYSENGYDKGFDIYIKLCEKLLNKYPNINCYIFGTFGKEDIKNKELRERIIIIKNQHGKKFNYYLQKMDIMISPNKNNILSKGAFDGFPTGSCSDGMLNKVAVFASDPLNIGKKHYKDWKEIIYIKPDVGDIMQKIEYIIHNPDLLKQIQNNGYNKARTIYSNRNQMKKREKIFKKIYKEEFYEKK